MVVSWGLSQTGFSFVLNPPVQQFILILLAPLAPLYTLQSPQLRSASLLLEIWRSSILVRTCIPTSMELLLNNYWFPHLKWQAIVISSAPAHLQIYSLKILFSCQHLNLQNLPLGTLAKLIAQTRNQSWRRNCFVQQPKWHQEELPKVGTALGTSILCISDTAACAVLIGFPFWWTKLWLCSWVTLK